MGREDRHVDVPKRKHPHVIPNRRRHLSSLLHSTWGKENKQKGKLFAGFICVFPPIPSVHLCFSKSKQQELHWCWHWSGCGAPSGCRASTGKHLAYLNPTFTPLRDGILHSAASYLSWGCWRSSLFHEGARGRSCPFTWDLNHGAWPPLTTLRRLIYQYHA